MEVRENIGITEKEGMGLGGTLVGFLSELLRLKCIWDIPVTLYVCYVSCSVMSDSLQPHGL